MGGESDSSKDRKSNEKIAEQNLEFQRENLDWQKSVQNVEWSREDDTYARTIADARSAGISPLALQGLNDSGEIVNTEAMHNDMHYDEHSKTMDKIQAIQDIISLTNNLVASGQQLSANQQEIEQKKLENQYLQSTMNSRVASTNYDKRSKEHQLQLDYINASNATREEKYNSSLGFFRGMSDFDKANLLAAQKLGNASRSTEKSAHTFYNPDTGFSENHEYNSIEFQNASSYATQLLSAMAVDKLSSYAMDLLKAKASAGKSYSYDYSNNNTYKYGDTNISNGQR